MWRSQASSGADLMGIELRKVSIIRSVAGRNIDAIVTGSGGKRYGVVIRAQDKGECFLVMCSCPDKRDGYCKHVSAVKAFISKPMQPLGLQSEYLQSAFGQLDADSFDEAKCWLDEFAGNEKRMEGSSSESIVSMVLGWLQHDKDAAKTIVQLLGGKFTESSGYQAMSTTQYFDIKQILHDSNAVSKDKLIWIVLYLLHDVNLEYVKEKWDECSASPKAKRTKLDT